MHKKHGKTSHKLLYSAFAVTIILVCALVVWLIMAAKGITSGFTENMNTMYLREMTNLTQANFKSGLSMRYSALKSRTAKDLRHHN